MLHHFQLDMVDQVLRVFKRNDLPFGGVQVVLSGDFFQLPPVSSSQRDKPRFVYHSLAWRTADFHISYLNTQFRQSDADFLEILSDIRQMKVTDKTKQLLSERKNKKPDKKLKPTQLHTHNVDVDLLNKKELALLSGSEKVYQMTSRGKKPLVDQLVKSCLAPEFLSLKVGASVMFVKNNFEAGYANGSLGEVVSLSSSGPIVRLLNGREVSAEPTSWVIEEDGKIKAEISQVPLRLAWAITVHKSQGMSLDAVFADLSQSFEPGMGYVALSRVKSLEGLFLHDFNEMSLLVNQESFKADLRLKELSFDLEQKITSNNLGHLDKEALLFVEKNGGKVTEKKKSTYQKTKDLLLEKLSLSDIAKTRGVNPETVLAHLEKIVDDDSSVDINYLKKEISANKLNKILKVIADLDDGSEVRLSPVKNKLGSQASFNDIRLARVFYKKQIR